MYWNRGRAIRSTFVVIAAFMFLTATQGVAQEKAGLENAATQGVAQEQQGQEKEPHKEAHHGKSADELAKELNNPNNDIAKLTFKNQYRWYDGDLPDADKQHNYTLLFQPVFPFGLGQTEEHKSVLFLRPAIPFVFEQPTPTVENGEFDFDGTTALADITIDLAYGRTYKTGWLWLAGIVGTLPAASDSDIGGKQWRLGPEAVLGYIQKWGLLGVFPSHEWDIDGWGEGDQYNYSTTTIQTFAMFTPGGGWAIGTQPIMTYDWVDSQWTIPLNLVISKTVLLGKVPFKFDLDINYYVEQPDAFGPEWMVGLNVTPIVPNFIARWIKGM